MILASVVVIACTVALLLEYGQRDRAAHLRTQGTGLARVLAGVPMAELVNREHDYGALNVLRLTQEAEEFAYGIVTGPRGNVLNAVTAPGMQVPHAALPAQPSAWAGERNFANPVDGREVIEFHAPVFNAGQHVGTVRIGYFAPGLPISPAQFVLLGTIAMAIFLLTPLFYFLVRREIRPIHAANREMADLIADGNLRTFSVEASGELRGFMARFNQVVELAQSRITALQAENAELVSSQKLVTYSRRRVENVLQSMPDGIVILGQDGKATFANDRVKALLGVEPQDILGSPPSRWCVNEEVTRLLSRYETNPGTSYFADTLRIKRSQAGVQGHENLAVKVYPLFSPQDPEAVQGQLVVFQDTTKLSMAEQSRANFVAHVAHELKSPLNTLGLYAEALQGERGEDAAFRVEAYNVFRDEVERLATLVNNLLSITQIEMGSLNVDKQRVKLKDLLEDAFEQVSRSSRAAGLRLSIDLPPEISAVAVDKQLLRIAVNNLLVNAVKYTEPGGEVELSAVETPEAIRISVRDTGIGIAEQERERVFDKFFRSEDERVRKLNGHGLGLSLARDIVSLHRGRLSVTSEPGKGSDFVIELWKDQGLLRQAI